MMRLAWRVLMWLFATAVVTVTMCVAADRTERLPGQGAWSPQALEVMDGRQTATDERR